MTDPRVTAQAATAAPGVQREQEVATEERLDTPWRVVLFNDDVHTFDEVIFQVVKATGCTFDHAERLAWQVHLEGQACVFEGSLDACLRVDAVLGEINLVTQIQG